MIVLGVDLGKARTGLAICDKAEMLATPLAVIHEHNREKLIQKIAETAVENKAELFVVGLPRNMDGSEGQSAVQAREIGTLLAEATGIPVEYRDERGTTLTAHKYLNATNTRGKKRKQAVDAVAATVILQNHLDYRRNLG